jgi:hypothetical protein
LSIWCSYPSRLPRLVPLRGIRSVRRHYDRGTLTCWDTPDPYESADARYRAREPTRMALSGRWDNPPPRWLFQSVDDVAHLHTVCGEFLVAVKG